MYFHSHNSFSRPVIFSFKAHFFSMWRSLVLSGSGSLQGPITLTLRVRQLQSDESPLANGTISIRIVQILLNFHQERAFLDDLS